MPLAASQFARVWGIVFGRKDFFVGQGAVFVRILGNSGLSTANSGRALGVPKIKLAAYPA